MLIIKQPTTQISFLNTLFEVKNQNKSYIFIIISCIAWVSGYIYANQHKFTPIETNLSRSIIIVIGSFCLCRLMHINIEYKSRKTWNTLIKRHLAFILQGFVIAGAQFFLPLGILHTISTAGPIFTLILQKILYQNDQSPLTHKKLMACIIVIIGILLTSNGKFIYAYFDTSFEFSSSFQNYISQSYGVMILATLVLIITLFIWSYGVLITQEAQCHAFAIVFHFGLMNLLVNAVGYFLIVDKRPASEIYESLLWVGLFLFIAEISFTLGLNVAENIGLSMVTGFTIVVVGYGLSILRYGQNVEIVSLIGTFLVLYGVGSIILTNETVKTNKNENEGEKGQQMSFKESQ